MNARWVTSSTDWWNMDDGQPDPIVVPTIPVIWPLIYAAFVVGFTAGALVDMSISGWFS